MQWDKKGVQWVPKYERCSLFDGGYLLRESRSNLMRMRKEERCKTMSWEMDLLRQHDLKSGDSVWTDVQIDPPAESASRGLNQFQLCLLASLLDVVRQNDLSIFDVERLRRVLVLH